MAQSTDSKTIVSLALDLENDYTFLLAIFHRKSTENFACSVRSVTDSILAFCPHLGVQSVPGNENGQILQLQNHCSRVASLLQDETIDRELILAGCNMALLQLYTLLEQKNHLQAAVVRTLCPIQEGTAWTTKTRQSSCWNGTVMN